MIFVVQNTSLGRGVKIEAESEEKALDSVCYYKDWRRVECRVQPEKPIPPKKSL